MAALQAVVKFSICLEPAQNCLALNHSAVFLSSNGQNNMKLKTDITAENRSLTIQFLSNCRTG